MRRTDGHVLGNSRPTITRSGDQYYKVPYMKNTVMVTFPDDDPNWGVDCTHAIRWILSTGKWDDNGIWVDSAFWNDGVSNYLIDVMTTRKGITYGR